VMMLRSGLKRDDAEVRPKECRSRTHFVERSALDTADDDLRLDPTPREQTAGKGDDGGGDQERPRANIDHNPSPRVTAARFAILRASLTSRRNSVGIRPSRPAGYSLENNFRADWICCVPKLKL
jgi:hypothetical protein